MIYILYVELAVAVFLAVVAVLTLRSVTYSPLFWLIHMTSFNLVVLGVPLIALAAALHGYDLKGPVGRMRLQWTFPPMWVYGNLEDGISVPGRAVTWWNIFYWSALRNTCNNLRYVPGVSKAGRPLWLRTRKIRGKNYYAKAGWLSNGYPCLSAGAGQW